jgi:hypothetical protein
MTKRLTKDMINADTSISKEMKGLLNANPSQNDHPYQLMRWAKQLFKRSRELGHDDEEIAAWIEVYALSRKGNWSKKQVANIISCNITGCQCV